LDSKWWASENDLFTFLVRLCVVLWKHARKMLHETNNNRFLTPFKAVMIIALMVGLTFSSCKKEEETIALVRIVDIEGKAVSGAFVELFPEPTEIDGQQAGELIEKVTQLTDANGDAVFDFTEDYQRGQAGFAVLSIDAYKDSLAVQGIIRIDPETINQETLILQ